MKKGLPRERGVPLPSFGVMLNEVSRHYRRNSLEHVGRRVKRLKSCLAWGRADETTTDHLHEYAEKRQEEAANAMINREPAALRSVFNLALKAGKVKPEKGPYFEMLPENSQRIRARNLIRAGVRRSI